MLQTNSSAFSLNTLCYAHDITLKSSKANAVEGLLGKVSSELSELGLKVNPQKFIYIIFKRRPNVVVPE